MAKKKQPEIPGFERPTNEHLDQLVAGLIEAQDEQASWKTKASDRKAALVLALQEQSGGLEKNADGDPVYYYNDGVDWHCYTLAAKTELQAKKAAPDTKKKEQAA